MLPQFQEDIGLYPERVMLQVAMVRTYCNDTVKTIGGLMEPNAIASGTLANEESLFSRMQPEQQCGHCRVIFLAPISKGYIIFRRRQHPGLAYTAVIIDENGVAHSVEIAGENLVKLLAQTSGRIEQYSTLVAWPR